MADKVILAEQTLDSIPVAEALSMVGIPVIPLVAGKTYYIFWDGTKYECVSDMVSLLGNDIIGVGNLAIVGAGADTGEPFVLGVMADGSDATAYTASSASTHTIAIYEAVDEDKEYLIYESTLTGIANAIRGKRGRSDPIKVADMADEIDGITVGSAPVIESLSVTQSGTYTASSGVDGYSPVVVDVPSKEPVISPLTVTENGTYTPEEGVDGFSPVTVNVAASGDDGSYKAVIERTATNPTLPADLTKIGNYAFYTYTSLALTSLPDGVTEIGLNAFADCTNLKLTSLPAGLTSIGGSAFARCTQLALTSLPDGVTEIGQGAFHSCTNLKLTSLPAGLTSIGATTFSQCGNMKLTSLPAGMTSIGSQAFFNCWGLTEITFEGTPTSINSYAFYSCTNLKTINVPWAEGAVANAPWGATNATINYNYTGG